MEHIPLPFDHDPILTSTPLEYVGESYDNEDFDTYPDRRGFDITLNVFNDEEFDPATTRSFYHTWIYFGLLHAVLDVSDPSLFLKRENGKICLTTAKLKDVMQSHRNRLLSSGRTEQFAWATRVERSLKVANRGFMEVDLLHSSRMVWGMKDKSVFPLWLPVVLLARALMRYFDIIVQEDYFRPDNGTGRKEIGLVWHWGNRLEHVLESRGFCISERKKILHEQLEAQIYLASLKVSRDKALHINCSAESCEAETVNEDVYQTKHVDKQCRCDFLGASINELCVHIAAKRLPVIRIDFRSDDSPGMPTELQLTCDSVELREFRKEEIIQQGGDNFVAISHVWADGLGNSNHNALPRCQLLRLAKFCQGLLSSQEDSCDEPKNAVDKFSMPHGTRHIRTLRIWIDTLCVPLEPQYRRMAIQVMNKVYRQARHVLVLDRQLQEYPYFTAEEAMSRVYISGWMRRAWTFMEGVIGGKRIAYRFSNRSINERFLQDLLMPEAKNAILSMELNIIRDFAINFGQDSLLELRKYFYDTNLHQPIVRRDSEIYRLNESTSTTMFDSERLRLLNGLWSAMERRSVTKKEDLVIIAATILGIDTMNFTKHHPDDRIRILYELLLEVPADVLFSNIERLDVEPFCWAPWKFSGSVWGEDIQGDIRLGYVTQRGLRVKFNGIFFDKGLLVDAVSHFVVGETIYEIYAWTKGTQKDEGQQLLGDILNAAQNGVCLILNDYPDFLDTRIREDGNVTSFHQMSGALISRKESSSSNGVISGRYELLMMVERGVNDSAIKDKKVEDSLGVRFLSEQEFLIT